MKRIRVKWADIVNGSYTDNARENLDQGNHTTASDASHVNNNGTTSSDRYHLPPKYPPIRDNLQQQVDEILQRRRSRSQIPSMQTPSSQSYTFNSTKSQQNANLSNQKPSSKVTFQDDDDASDAYAMNSANASAAPNTQPRSKDLIQKMKYYQPPM